MQRFFEILPCCLRLDAASHIDEHLLGDLIGFQAVLDKIDLQLMAQELRHGLLDEFVGDGLLRLVLIGGLRGEGRNDEDQAVLNILKAYLAVALEILAVLLEIGVDLGNECAARGLFRRTAVLQKARIVKIFLKLLFIREAERSVYFHFIIGLVRAIAALALRLPVLHAAEGVFPGEFLHIIGNTVFIEILVGIKALLRLIPQYEAHPGIHDRLPLDRFLIILQRHVDIREDLQIWPPTDGGAGIFLLIRLLDELSCGLAMLKMYLIAPAVPVHLCVHILRGILRGAKPQAVKAERIFIAAVAVVGVVFAARIELAENELPVELAFILIVIHRNAAAEILHLDGAVDIAGHHDLVAEALACLVNGVGENFENRVLAALQPVRTKDNGRTLAHPVRPFERCNIFIAIAGLLFRHVTGHPFAERRSVFVPSGSSAV